MVLKEKSDCVITCLLPKMWTIVIVSLSNGDLIEQMLELVIINKITKPGHQSFNSIPWTKKIRSLISQSKH